MTNQELIEDLKRRALEDPIIINADGTHQRLPTGGYKPLSLVVMGRPVSLLFTWDMMPSSQLRAEHLSIMSADGQPITRELELAVLELVFGQEAWQAKTHPFFREGLSGANQWCLFHHDAESVVTE